MQRLTGLIGCLMLGVALLVVCTPRQSEAQVIYAGYGYGGGYGYVGGYGGYSYGGYGYYAPAYYPPAIPVYSPVYRPVYAPVVPIYAPPAAYYGYGYVPRRDLGEIEIEYKWRNGYYSVEIDYDD